MGVGDSDKGLYDHLYRRFFENRASHQGYEFQHAPGGSAPLPVVTFRDRLRWWTWGRWQRRKAILAARDRFQQDILDIKKRPPKKEEIETRDVRERGVSVNPKRIGMVSVVLGVAVIAGKWSFCVEQSQAIQAESRAEKEANLKGQAQGGLFNRWTFDQQKSGEAPAAFSMLEFGEGPAAAWTIKADTDAPSASNILAVNSSCQTMTCYRLIVANGIQYEYPDVSVMMRFPVDVATAVGGVVFGVKDATHFYAAVVDLATKTLEVSRVVDGKETRLGRSSITPKAVPWHTLRVQRNTILSKDFIETFFDGQLVVTVEDQSLAIGQVGLLVRGQTALNFDSLHAIPLFSQRPLSAPAAY